MFGHTSNEANAKPPKQKRGSLDEDIERIRAQLAGLRKNGQPVIAGPFTGEVGFELLYWIPFLRWAVRVCPELGEDLIVVSRGGVEGWVEGLGARYVDILALFEPEEFAAHRALADKQRDIKAFDQRVIERVQRELGIEEAAVLHPSMMFEAYFRFLKINQLAYVRALKRREDAAVDGLTSIYEPIRPRARPALPLTLPGDYVAVRFAGWIVVGIGRIVHSSDDELDIRPARQAFGRAQESHQSLAVQEPRSEQNAQLVAASGCRCRKENQRVAARAADDRRFLRLDIAGVEPDLAVTRVLEGEMDTASSRQKADRPANAGFRDLTRKP
jgi:hypothetical protein